MTILNNKAVALLSGGLDSLLALKLMVEQGIEVTALHFTSPFCTCGGKNSSCGSHAVESGKEIGVNVKVIFKGLDYIDIVRNPKHGYGSHLNPCIDCRIYAFNKAKEFMQTLNASFVITGEVLGQRPMSQRRDTINLIERESGLKGLIVRPLSAKHFPPSLPEIHGIIDREKLLDISGRGRKVQIKKASEKGIINYPCPAGGCLLTDPLFSQKVKDLLDNNINATLQDVNLLKIGRHFRLSEKLKIIVGKDEKENVFLRHLVNLKGNGFTGYLEPVNFAGPVVLLNGEFTENDVMLAGQAILRYSKKGIPEPKVRFFSSGEEETISISYEMLDVEKYNVVKGG